SRPRCWTAWSWCSSTATPRTTRSPSRDYLLPRQTERAALTTEEVTVTDAALRKIAADYTREPGVRQFERLLAKALRKAATKLASETNGDPEPLWIDEPD